MTTKKTRRYRVRQYSYSCDGHKITLSRALATACGRYTDDRDRSPAAEDLWREVCEDIRARLPGWYWEIYVHCQWTSNGYPYPVARLDARR